MSWTEEKVAKLKELWGKGNTASQIAEIIGGISRNAVIGKAHRLNLSAKIKTRTAVSNQNIENSVEVKNIQSKNILGLNYFELSPNDCQQNAILEFKSQNIYQSLFIYSMLTKIFLLILILTLRKNEK